MEDDKNDGFNIDEINRRIRNKNQISSKHKRGKGERSANQSESGSWLVLASFVMIFLSLILDIYSIEVLSNLAIGDSMVISKLANAGYAVAIILMIMSQNESKKSE